MGTDILKYASRLEFDKVLAEAASHAVSAGGKQKILETVPSVERDEVVHDIAATAAMTDLISKNGSPSLSDVSGIGEIAMRAEKGGCLSMAELLSVRVMLLNARRLLSWKPELAEPEIEELFYPLYCNDSFERLIGENILSDTEIADTASAKLADIRRRIARAEQSIRERLDSIVRGQDQKYLQDAIVTMRGGRYVVPVRQEYKSEIKGLVHDVSGSGSTFFIEPEAVVEANNTIVTLKGEETIEIERILFSMSQEVAGFAAQLRYSYETFVDIDVSLAKARYAIAHDCTVPRVSSGKNVVLRKARHPLIPKNKVVPIDIPIGVDYSMLVITGPNTGGKTVTLKTVGLLCMMAMAGMLIPAADGSEVAVFTSILVDIGDEQSIEQSLSTFSGHIKNIIEILKMADRNSLVLLDELGAGTDPAEGSALAEAILERFREIGCIALATTHYGEIKMYALETDGVQNASCEFDLKTLSPTYRITVGVPGRSNAFLISEKLGLDGEIIEEARRAMSGESRRFDDVLTEIEQLKGELSEKIAAAETDKADAAEERRRAKAEAEKIKKQAQKELENAENRARQLVGDVSAGAYKLLDELKKIERDKEKDSRERAQRARAIARAGVEKLYDMPVDMDFSNAEDYEPVTQAAVGDTVILISIGKPATVISPPDKKGNLEVAAGSIKSRVNLKDLGKPEGLPSKKKNKPKADVDAKTFAAAVPSEINLIGLTTTEAQMELERYISTAVMAHLSEVRIIHGKGTGALRAAVQQTLKKLGKQVKAFRLGRYGEGEDGVTIAELK